MLPQAPARLEPRYPRRGLLTVVGGLLSLVVFVSGVGFAKPDPPQKDETKKSEPKKDKTDDKQPNKGELKKERVGKDETKKSDEEKEIDELVKQFKQNNPNATQDHIRQYREQLRNSAAMRRKYKQNMIQAQRQQPGFPGQPPIGGGMPPGFLWLSQNVRLGARVEPVSDTLAEQLDLPKGQGLVVREVVAESAAAKAGIKNHDVLLKFNGKAVPNRVEDFARQMTDIKPDKAVEIVVLRKGKKETIKDVKLPEAKPGLPGFPQVGFPGAGQLPGAGPQLPGGLPKPAPGFPQPQFGFPQQPGLGGQAFVRTTMTRTKEHFTLRHEEGSLVITLTGPLADGKAKIKEITVQDGLRSEPYESVDKVPERYRDKVKNLVEMSEKSSVRIEVK